MCVCVCVSCFGNIRQVSGRDPNDNQTALKKGERMAKENVRAMSFFRDGGLVFFSGIVEAEMKKAKYITRITINYDGDIKNADCDCPAGKGPTASCKHVVAQLFILANFIESGELSIAGSCTDTLQTFKKPSIAHAGAPVQAENIHPGASEDDDPRPLKYRNRETFTDELFMTIVNYTAKSSSDISWRYMIPRADLESAQIDHDYLKDPYCQY